MGDDETRTLKKTAVDPRAGEEGPDDPWIGRLRSAVAALHSASALATQAEERERLRFAARVISTILGDEPPPRGAPAELTLLRRGP